MLYKLIGKKMKYDVYKHTPVTKDQIE